MKFKLKRERKKESQRKGIELSKKLKSGGSLLKRQRKV